VDTLKASKCAWIMSRAVASFIKPPCPEQLPLASCWRGWL
jgi:hypothetical protein